MIDSHNHLQQLAVPARALAEARSAGVTRMVVNGTCEEDWSQVADLAASHAEVLPSFGLHPWQVGGRSQDWISRLDNLLAAHPGAGVGECGLDRWKKPFDLAEQTSCLSAQIEIAKKWQRPLTLHCLQAWGAMLAALREHTPLPPFLLHAYSGSAEMIPAFVELGGYFSFSGYFLHERKEANRRAFQQVPLSRLLLETDAPAMLPPPRYRIATDSTEDNYPENLIKFLPPLAGLRDLDHDELAGNLAQNFRMFWGEESLSDSAMELSFS